MQTPNAGLACETMCALSANWVHVGLIEDDNGAQAQAEVAQTCTSQHAPLTASTSSQSPP
jgi:hypothetical protein